jgi:trimeric autotransporter adhesin
MGSTQSQYVTPRDFTLGQVSSPLKLQYVPNSMVITQDGSVIYMGSSQGLETISTANNTLGAVNENVPGTVLAVSPDDSTVVITDPIRQTVSLYSASSSAVTTSYNGVANSARWSPDSQTVYITLQNSNLVLTHSSFTNWEQTTLDGKDQAYTDAAVMVPSVGAFFAGQYTEARSYCPAGTLSGTTTPQTVNNNFAPLANETTTTTDKIAATNDRLHIIGATTTTPVPTLSDINLSNTINTINTTTNENAEQSPCPPAGTTLPNSYFPSTLTTTPLTGITATAINNVVPAANSSVAFITYTGASGILPEYIPSASGAGTFVPLTLGNGATAASAPLSGVFSTDGTTFYAGTSGDNQVHVFTLSGTTATETTVITPALPLFTGTGTAQIDLLVQKPKKTLN